MQPKKMPRKYAQEIQELKSIDERRAALALVPEHFQKMVKEHLMDAYLRRKAGAVNEAKTSMGGVRSL